MLHYKQAGLCTRTHGNSKRAPSNAIPYDDVRHLTTYITNFAKAHGMPLPGRVPGHRDKVMVLPSDITKVFVYTKYREACSANGWEAAGRSKFFSVWQESLPHISISKPSSDLCYTCQKNSLKIQKAGCLPDEEKAELYKTAQDHIQRARTERDHYKSQAEVAKSAWEASENGKYIPTLGHYSYDFAQQVHFPFSSQQTGPEFFKTARKCAIFGVCNDGKSQQVNYLIDEAENPGKGADCVISLVHHYLEKHGCKEKSLNLHADNCTAQNKNNATIQYMMWRVMADKNESIQLSFMLVGHTKFSPDRFFGHFKKVFRHSTVSTFTEIASVMERSTHNHQNVPQLVRGPGNEKLVEFYQWSTHLSQFFKAIPNILSYRGFRVTNDKPGIVYLKEFSDSTETSFDIRRPDLNKDLLLAMPQLTPICGLDLQRQWYLCENIRQHCHSTLGADLTCPKPTLPKPHNTPASDTMAGGASSADEPARKRQRKCGKCGNPGHNIIIV